MSDKVGTQRTIQFDKINAKIGSIDSINCKSFYINIGFWIKINSDVEDKDQLVRMFKQKMNHYIRAIAPELHPSYLYSFIDDQLPENLGDACYHGYCAFEVTILLKDTIKDYKYNEELEGNIYGFCSLIESKMLELSNNYTITRRKVKL